MTREKAREVANAIIGLLWLIIFVLAILILGGAAIGIWRFATSPCFG